MSAASFRCPKTRGWKLRLALAVALVVALGVPGVGHAQGAAKYSRAVAAILQEAELTAGDGAAYDQFGYTVAISGDGNTALVGAPYHAANGNDNQGAVYVFTLSEGGWIQQPDLTASDGAFGDYFGSSVALSNDGTTAVIGALGHAVNGSNQGAAYVFTFSNGSWHQQELTAADGAAGDAFGAAVAVSSDGTTALVGAPAHSNQGAAYVFTFSSGNWTQQPDLVSSDIAISDAFGSSVALGGDATALIGSPYHNVNGNKYEGAAYVFGLFGSSWSQEQELTASDGAADDLFGASVALANSGNTALVGAPLSTINGNIYAGSAYVFGLSEGWFQEQELTAGSANGGFGNSVALSGNGNTALVGATLADINGMSNQGAAYAFAYTGENWTLQQELTAGDGTANDYFSNSVALSNDGATAVLGALDHAVNGNIEQGAAYVWGNLASQLVATPGTLNFPTIGVGSTFPRTVLIMNTGATKVLVGTVSITPVSGDLNAFHIREFCVPRTLRPGKKCVVGITFAPHEAGLSTATLNVPSNAPGPQLQVPITGTGISKK
jgi:hypothetical protein